MDLDKLINMHYRTQQEDRTMTLTPAYGRDYKCKKAVQTDWDNGKDFIIADFMHPYSGKHCNKADLQKEGLKTVMIRYNNLRSIQSFKV